MVGSQKWGYVRIITGTLLGGVLGTLLGGFYLMHRAETSYKEKMNENLRKYKLKKMRKESLNEGFDKSLNEIDDSI